MTSIISKEWEYIDPTPDIHMLFLQFNQRFFWGQLEGVVVKWSSRMKLCAGVCCYEGRGGLCSVRLSEPLLKLRPRKDLVETLLHEMIHAFLFVTQNDRDRDGHGPEFQKHMHRINKDSGCNITIYHNFHEEVRLYQKHVWRCDGPCQKSKPYFGFVRRSMNRAPGPTDPWFSQHQATCGGKYIKIQEPERFPKKPKQNKAGDITKYIFTDKGNTVGASGSGTSSTSDHTKSKINGVPITNVKPGTNVKGFDDFGSGVSGQSSTGKPKTNGVSTSTNVKPGSNVTDFGSRQTNSDKSRINGGPSTSGTNIKTFGDVGRPLGGGGVRGGVANRGGKTLVVTGGRGRATTTDTIQTPQTSFTPFQGTGFVLGSSTITSATSRSNVNNRNNLNTSSTTSLNNNNAILIEDSPKKIKEEGKKRPESKSSLNDSVIVIEESPPKKFKTDTKITDWFPKSDSEPTVNCPICNKKMAANLVDIHLDECSSFSPKEQPSQNDSEPIVKCPVCNKEMSANLVDIHLDECSSLTVSPKREPEQIVKCPDCNKEMPDYLVGIHLDECNSTKQPSQKDSEPLVKCPVCNKEMSAHQIDSHLDQCLSLMTLNELEPPSDKIATKPSTSSETIVIDDDDNEKNMGKCPLCEGYYSSDKLEDHISECVTMLHDAFEADDVAQQAEVPKVGCPICQANINADDINKHVDECLNPTAIKETDF